MIFLTRAGREGSRAPITRIQSPGWAPDFRSARSSSRSRSALAMKGMGAIPLMISSEDIFLSAVPPA